MRLRDQETTRNVRALYKHQEAAEECGFTWWAAFQVICITGRVLAINIEQQREMQRAEILAVLAMFGDGNVVQ